MKKIILLCAIYFFAILNICLSQWNPFSTPVRLTNGNNDRNPSFKSNSNVYESTLGWDWEFMAFERVSGNSSQICVGKINFYGSLDSAVYLTNDIYRNINPEISYNQYYFSLGKTPKYAIVVWESNKYGLGRSSIYGSIYIRNSGWSSALVVDSSLSDNIKPKIHSLDSTTFLIVYESSNQIKYKKYNILTNTFSTDETLTSGNFLHSPYITSFRDDFNNIKVIISYEKELIFPNRAIYFRKGSSDSISMTENPSDTIAYIGENYNQGFQSLSFSKHNLFLTNRNGNFNIYGTTINSSNNTQIPLILNSSYFIFNYVGVDYPITDNLNPVLNYFYAFNRKRTGEIKIIIKNSPFSFTGDSVIYSISNNESYKTKSSISAGIHLSNTASQRYWIVFNKDSIHSSYPSKIYGINFTNSLSNVNYNSLNNINSFILSQNYPNPFNPSTNINFSIPKSSFVTLKVYDVMGKEISSLINENLNAGVYSFDFNAGDFASGVYFYKLTAGDYSDIKKMTLLK